MRYLGPNEIEAVMGEVHSGDCGSHLGERRLFEQLISTNHFWPPMENDAVEFVRNCEICERLGNLVMPPQLKWAV